MPAGQHPRLDDRAHRPGPPVQLRHLGQSALEVGHHRQHHHQPELGIVAQGGGEVLADVVRPQILVLDVDQPVGLGDRLGVRQHHRALALGSEVEPLGSEHREGADDLHDLVPVGTGIRWGPLVAERLGGQVLAVEQARQQPSGVDGERGAVLPALAERRLDVVHRRALDGHLDVVPCRGRAVGLRELHRLLVAAVVVVVTPAVTEIYPADVGDIAGRFVAVADDDELLVVRSARADAHVPQALPAGFVDLLAQVQVAVRAVAESVPVGAPQQPADVDAALHRGDERGAEGRARVVRQLLVGIALPVGEVETVAGAQVADALVELLEVGTSVDDGPDRVPRRSRRCRRRGRRRCGCAGSPAPRCSGTRRAHPRDHLVWFVFNLLPAGFGRSAVQSSPPWIREAVSRLRRLTRAVVYAVVVAVPLGDARVPRAYPVRPAGEVRPGGHRRGGRLHPRPPVAGERSSHAWEAITRPVVVYLLLGLPVSLYVWFGKNLRTRAWWAMATMAAGWGIAALLKLLVGRARPEIDDPIAAARRVLLPLRSRHQQRHRDHRGPRDAVALAGLWPAAAAGRRRRGSGCS